MVQTYEVCTFVVLQCLKTSSRWTAASSREVSYDDALELKETKVTPTKNHLRVATENNNSNVTTVRLCYPDGLNKALKVSVKSFKMVMTELKNVADDGTLF